MNERGDQKQHATNSSEWLFRNVRFTLHNVRCSLPKLLFLLSVAILHVRLRADQRAFRELESPGPVHEAAPATLLPSLPTYVPSLFLRVPTAAPVARRALDHFSLVNQSPRPFATVTLRYPSRPPRARSEGRRDGARPHPPLAGRRGHPGRQQSGGFPFTWIPNHLADADGTASPRSFVAALRAAANDTADRHPEYDYALHYDSVKRGVQEASRIRVRELREDYPWVDRLLVPLEGVVVPCEFGEIEGIWGTNGALDHLSDQIGQNDVKLPPRDSGRGAVGVREDLESLGVFRRLRNGRVDVPDVFRVGYGLGRRGGVRPVA